MSSLNNRIPFHEMSFDGLTNYETQTNFQRAKNRIHKLMDTIFLTENNMEVIFKSEEYKAFRYFGFKRDAYLSSKHVITEHML